MLKRYGVLSLAVIALLLIPLIAAAQGEHKAPTTVPVHFAARPDLAEIRVDGVFIGTSPLSYRLTPGVHKIELSRRGFQTWQRELTVNADMPTNVTALLEDVERPCPPAK